MPTPQSLAQELAMHAGQMMIDARAHSTIHVQKKSEVDLVTEVDLAVEAYIIEQIGRHFPDHAVLSEETNSKLSSTRLHDGPLWIIDPIDGTTNYAHQHFHSSVSIAYAENGIVEFGIVHCPFLNECFKAERGAGAFCNDRTIQCSTTQELKDSLVGSGFPYHRENIDELLRYPKNILLNCRGLRRNGAASIDICWVACGRLEGYFEIAVNAWDVAAAGLIAREAGALTGQLLNHPEDQAMPEQLKARYYVCAAPGIFQEFCTVLRN